MAITRLSEFRAAPQCDDELYSFLCSLEGYIKSSPGCVSVGVLRNIEDPLEMVVIEQWIDTESHQQSVAAYPKEKMQAAMSMIAAPPKGRYFQGVDSE